MFLKASLLRAVLASCHCVLLGLMKIGASQALLLRGKAATLVNLLRKSTQASEVVCKHTHTHLLWPWLLSLPVAWVGPAWCIPAGVYHSWCFSPFGAPRHSGRLFEQQVIFLKWPLRDGRFMVVLAFIMCRGCLVSSLRRCQRKRRTLPRISLWYYLWTYVLD